MKNIKKHIRYFVFQLVLISLTFVFQTNFFIKNYRVYAEEYNKEDLKAVIEEKYNNRSAALVSGDESSLKQIFDTSKKPGKWALEHEIKRVKYLKYWATERKIKFTDIKSTVRIKKIYPRKDGIKIALDESYKFDYIYPQDENSTTNSFGVGIRHTVNLIKKEDKYTISADWYTDCFEDALSRFSGDIQNNSNSSEESFKNKDKLPVYNYNQHYNREKAVEYADKYCGAAWGNGNNFKYNNKYSDYNGMGGDCTNFASQVLGDKEAGGLKQDGAWHFNYSKYGNGSGTSTWVNTDKFKNYLIYSGKGRVIKVGTFKELTSPTPEYPKGLVSKLHVGDFVCYAKKTDIDHFAIVTAFDSHGYPLVNSHTTDRYHVPWDLGWGDSIIKFHLIHIND